MSRKEVFQKLGQGSDARTAMLTRARQGLSSSVSTDGEPPSRLLRIATSKRVLSGGAVLVASGAALSGTDLSEVIKAPVAVVRNIFDVRVVHADGNPNYIDNNEEPNPDGPPVDPTDDGYDGDLPIATPSPDTTIPHTTPTQPPPPTEVPPTPPPPTPRPTETATQPATQTATKTPEPTPTGTPIVKRIIQFIVKKRLDSNRNGQFDSQDRGMMQQFRGWIDRNLNRQPDSGEPVQSSATDPNGVSILTFEGRDLGPGTQVCAEEFDVAAGLVPVVSEDCAVVDGGNTAEVRLLNANREAPPVEPTVVPRREEPKVAPPPPAPEVAPPAPPAPEIPQVCVLPNGQEVLLPEEFKVQLIGKDAETIARMIGEFKCEFIEHDVVMREEHKDILDENKFAHAVLVRQHGDQTRILKGIDRELDTVRAGITDLSEDHETQTGILKDLKERIGNGWSAAREWAAIGLSAATLLLVGGLLLHRRRPDEGQPPVELPAPVVPPAPEGPAPAPHGAPAETAGAAEGAAAVVVGAGAAGAAEAAEPQAGRFTNEQINILAQALESLDRIFKTIDEMSDDQIARRIRSLNMTPEQTEAFKQVFITSIMVLSEEENENELNRLSTVRLIRRLSVKKREISPADLLRITQVRGQLRAAQRQAQV